MTIEVDTMKRVDRYLGSPICFLLTLFRYAVKFFTPASDPKPLSLDKVLFIELSEMGSMVAASPVMRAFQERHPGVEVYFLTFRQNRACLDALHLLPRENVITIDNSSLGQFAATTLKALREVRALRLDAVIDFELFSRVSTILGYLAGAKRSAGFDRLSLEGLYRGDLKTHPVGYNHYAHISRNFASLLCALEGGEVEAALLKTRIELPQIPIPRPPMDASRRADVWKRLQAECPELRTDSKLIIMNPNAGNLLPIRAWPLPSYIELSRRLLEDPNICIAVMGTPEAADDAARMQSELKTPRLIDFTGKTSFADLIPLLSLGDVLLTNDSGPAHFASLTDTAILVFFGPETPDLYRPLAEKCDVFYSNYHCSPCLNAYNHRSTKCTNNLCLQCITVDEVEAKVKGCLEQYPTVSR